MGTHQEDRQHRRCRHQYLHCHQFRPYHYLQIQLHLMGTSHSSRIHHRCRHQYPDCHSIRHHQYLLAHLH